MTLYKRGSRGEMVRQIQIALHLCPDGMFGALTEEAVREFQRKNGLKADGIVGAATLAKLIPLRLKKSRRTIDEIIIHCTATPEGKDYDIETIRSWHLARGFSDIGYHYIIDRYGHVHTGRDVDISGAHCSGHNAHSIGIAYIGGCVAGGKTAKDTRTLTQKAALLSLLIDMRKLYPKAVILGHRDTSPDLNGNGIVEPCEWQKECPSFDAAKEYARL